MSHLSEMIVTCWCGRRMTLDSLRGPGRFRCGCGARIAISQPPARSSDTTCDITGCGQPIWHERLPETRLCAQHFDRLRLEIMPAVFAKYPVISWLKAERDYRDKYGDFYPDLTPTLNAQEVWAQQQDERRDDSHAPLVYFVIWGSRCKIGTTTNINARLSSLSMPRSALALTIPGDRDTEREMHQRFHRWRIGRTEWFMLDSPLQDYIAEQKQRVA